ncbi:hypothetical protein B7Y94_00780 [Candidatus Saccharibacteria bacterium 32-49-12]|nr:MAG: hypothetical protein B7Y94_00780 [Candidatus Saccharibacteria bacterium 32-49-12]
MVIFLTVLLGLLTLMLVVVASIKLRPSEISQFELHRRARQSDNRASLVLEKEAHLSELSTLLWLVTVLLLVGVSLLAVSVFDWPGGVTYAVLVALSFGSISRAALFKQLANRLYQASQPQLIKIIKQLRPLLKTLQVESVIDSDIYRRFDSREELVHLINQSGTILDSTERKFLTHGLNFKDKLVHEIMTPRAAIDSIAKDEFLGPLVLNELHSLGHSRLPVIDGDIDHIVGMLHLRSLLTLSDKQSLSVEQAMESTVYYIHEDDTLSHALAAFLRTRHHLFVVINENRETVGLLSLEDVIETLIGRKIVDEDDIHTDSKAVAASRSRDNNRPAHQIDL